MTNRRNEGVGAIIAHFLVPFRAEEDIRKTGRCEEENENIGETRDKEI